MATFDWIEDWAERRGGICEGIKRRKSDLKIVLKTKNDPFLLREWIEHHARIAGHENLVIFDNGSSDPAVAGIYAEFKDRVLIVRYGGFVDDLHKVFAFGELYAALRSSCARYAFLDTDEFLVWIDRDGTFLDGGGAAERILQHPGVPVLPGTWLSNVVGHRNRFWLKPDGGGLIDGLKWGKPLVSSDVDVSGYINHNCQLDAAHYGGRFVLQCFVLHLNRLSFRQRVSSNMNKLVALGVLKEGDAVAKVVGLDPNDYREGNIRLYLREIQQFAAMDDPPANDGSPLQENSIRLGASGSIEFQSAAQRAAMDAFMADAAQSAARAFAKN